jgi:hypothetical protein
MLGCQPDKHGFLVANVFGGHAARFRAVYAALQRRLPTPWRDRDEIERSPKSLEIIHPGCHQIRTDDALYGKLTQAFSLYFVQVVFYTREPPDKDFNRGKVWKAADEH